MKVTGITEAIMADYSPAWLISMDDASVIIQRRQLSRATESPMSPDEQLVCALCEFALRREAK